MDIFSEIPGSASWTNIEPVLKGWSSDKKYYIEDVEGRKLLLRLSESGDFHRKQAEYDTLKRFNVLEFPMSRAVNMGTCCQGRYTYMLLTWVEGRSLEECLADLSPQDQYHLGAEAGRQLRQMHTIPNDRGLPHWEEQMRAKMLSRIQEYEDCPYHVEGDEQAAAYVRANIGLIQDVEKVFQHGDYHVGNLILTDEGRIGVIDFNRWDNGDYVEEFYKLQAFDRVWSVPFARGKLEGYFEGPPTESFWARLALYVAYSSLYSIKWAIPYGTADIESMILRCRMALEDYDDFRSIIPRWYLEKTASTGVS